MISTVAIVTHRVVEGDGQGRVNYEIAKELLRQGYNLILVATVIASELKNIEQVSCIHIDTKGWLTALGRNLIFAWKSTSWIKRHRHEIDVLLVNGAITWVQPDINIAHFIHNAWLNSAFHTSRVRRDVYGIYHWLYTTLNAYWEKQAFRKAKVVVAVSNQVRQDLIQIGIPEDKICVIPNGVDVEEFKPGQVNRPSLGLPEDVLLALFAGDIRTPRKNLETVLKALVDVPEFHLAVAGSTERSPYPSMAHELGISHRVYFLGQRKDMPELMRAVNLLVFPSRYESFGLVILEALASGLPVVTSSSVGASDLVNGECGFVMSSSESLKELSSHLKYFILNKEKLNDWSKNARHIACDHTWKKMAICYSSLLTQTKPKNEATTINHSLNAPINK